MHKWYCCEEQCFIKKIINAFYICDDDDDNGDDNDENGDDDDDDSGDDEGGNNDDCRLSKCFFWLWSSHDVLPGGLL